MHRPYFSARLLALCLLAGLLLAACGVNPDAAPTLTPDAALPATAAAIFPTPVPTDAPTPTPVAESDASESIARLLADMQIAVITRNDTAYLDLVDLSDPVFALEHTRWVADWRSNGILRYDLAIRNLVVADDGQTATADFNVNWSVLQNTQTSRGADYPVRFTLGDDGRWRFAGEDWAITRETDHFTILGMAGMEPQVDSLIAFLPDVYERVTTLLGYEPANKQIIKIYNNPWALSATTRFSLIDEIAGWNEPGEALKIVAASTDDERVIAHEFAHFLTFELAGTTRGGYPWWVSEGFSEFAASQFWTQSDRNQRIAAVQERRQVEGLVSWDDLAVFETTPEALWPFSYLQGYAFMVFVTETYGDAQRNAWITAMADGDLESATQTVFEMAFDDLDLAFRDWLDAQQF